MRNREVKEGLNLIFLLSPLKPVHYAREGTLMGNGLLASWRRRIVARGVAGAVLLAVPVAVAAAIGFGTGFSGLAGGLSSVTSGPSASPPPAAEKPATNLNHAVVALANRSIPSRSASGGGSAGGGVDDSGGGSGSGTVTGVGGGSGTVSDTGAGSADSRGGATTSPYSPSIETPRVPNVRLPGGGSTGGATETVNGTVDQVVGGANNTLNGLIGK